MRRWFIFLCLWATLAQTAVAQGTSTKSARQLDRVERRMAMMFAAKSKAKQHKARRRILRTLKRLDGALPDEPRIVDLAAALVPAPSLLYVEADGSPQTQLRPLLTWCAAKHSRATKDQALIPLSWALALIGEQKKATLALSSRSARLDERRGTALSAIAELSIRRDDLSTATSALTLAERVATPSPARIRRLASVRLMQGKAAEAIRLLRTQLESQPSRLAQRMLADAYLQSGRSEEALRLLKMLADESSSKIDILSYASAALETHRFALAKDALLRLLERQPKDVDAWVLLALVESGQNRDAAALSILQKALRIAPKHRRAQALRKTLLGKDD